MTIDGRSSPDVILRLTSEIVAAYVGNNPLPSGEVPAIIRSVHVMLTSLNGGAAAELAQLKPAVPIKKSVTDNYIVCLEDGKQLKMLKRYLRSQYGMTPEDYRAKWGLPMDYPMVAPNYAQIRSDFAKKIGLGKSPRNPRKGRRRG